MNWDQFFASLAASLPVLLTALLAFWKSMRASAVVEQTKEKLDTMEKQINGRLTQLLKVTAVAENIKGHAEGVEQERVRTEEIASRPPPVPPAAGALLIFTLLALVGQVQAQQPVTRAVHRAQSQIGLLNFGNNCPCGPRGGQGIGTDPAVVGRLDTLIGQNREIIGLLGRGAPPPMYYPQPGAPNPTVPYVPAPGPTVPYAPPPGGYAPAPPPISYAPAPPSVGYQPIIIQNGGTGSPTTPVPVPVPVPVAPPSGYTPGVPPSGYAPAPAPTVPRSAMPILHEVPAPNPQTYARYPVPSRP